MKDAGVTIRRKPAASPEIREVEYIQFTQAVTLEGHTFPTHRFTAGPGRLATMVVGSDVIHIGRDQFPVHGGLVGQFRFK